MQKLSVAVFLKENCELEPSENALHLGSIPTFLDLKIQMVQTLLEV